MGIIKRSYLLRISKSIQDSTRIVRLQETLEKSASSHGDINVFLSHSHHDENLIEAARLILADQGVKCYIDRNDPDMPKKTSSETAFLLKEKIKSCDKFILLASNNALNSKWVPWELGYADSKKGLDNIAIFAVEEEYEFWKGSEYMSLYALIKTTTDNGLGVFSSGKNQGSSLSLWLNNSIKNIFG